MLLLGGMVAAASALAYARFLAGRPALRDFLSFYTGASLFLAAAPPAPEGGVAARLYSLADQQRVQAGLAAHSPFMPYLRPPLLAALLAPLARMPLEHAALVWLALNAMAALLLGAWCARRMNEPLLLLLLALFVPLLVSLNVGQDTPLLVLALVLWLCLLETDRPVAGGLLLALLWVKPQWLPPLILLLAARRQRRALGAFAAASAALWIVFPPLAYARFLLMMDASAAVPACVPCMPNLRALAPPLPLQAIATTAVLAVVVLWARWVPLAVGFALACCAALLAGHYTHIYDCLLLFPAIAAASRPPLGVAQAEGRALKMVLGLALSPLPYLAPYWSAYLRTVPALMVLAVFIALSTASKPGKNTCVTGPR